jgi:pectin methylesterase-like acyl-CoA thioesterase
MSAIPATKLFHGGALAAVMLIAAPSPASAAQPSRSVFALMPADPRAVIVAARGNGRADDSAAIQRAIDAAASQGAGQGGGGIVFLRSGRYRITRTIYLRPGVSARGGQHGLLHRHPSSPTG